MKEEFEFKTEIKPLLRLLTHSLYNNREVYLRELISNSSDAINKIRFLSLTDSTVLEGDKEFKITLEFDDKEKTLSITDNGIGMNKEDLLNQIGTIASSGTGNFLTELTGDQQKDMELIGKFGVGFYSVFMVADEVTIETRKYNEKQSYIWVSDGVGAFSIEESNRKERGTRIFFKFKENENELSSEWSIKETIRKYSDYIPYPIMLNKEQANRALPIWSQPKSEIKKKDYIELFKYIAPGENDPMFYTHINPEGLQQFNAILYIPSEVDKDLFMPERKTKLSLYARKVFIQNDCEELLPTWLRFVRGIVDSEDLPLNVSRESTQNNPILKQINDFLVKRLIAQFKKWIKSEKQFNKFETLWSHFGKVIKEGIHTDFTNRDRIVEIFHAYSSKSPDKLISLDTYLEGMKEEQKEIYYFCGPSKGIIENSPNMEYFLKNEIEVLYMYDDIDDFIVPAIGRYKDKELVHIEKADVGKLGKNLQKEKKEDLSDDSRAKMIRYFKDILQDKVGDVVESDRLINNPYTLVAPKDGMNAQMEKMMKMMNKDFVGAKKVLELNLDSNLLANLCKIRDRNPQDEVVKKCIEQIYENCLIMEGNLESNADSVPRMNSILDTMTSLYNEKISS